jgi:hypothetical protein
MKNPTFSIEPNVLKMLDIMLNTYQMFRIDARILPKADFEPIFLVWNYLYE